MFFLLRHLAVPSGTGTFAFAKLTQKVARRGRGWCGGRRGAPGAAAGAAVLGSLRLCLAAAPPAATPSA
jgi:hypothetical protein